MIYLRKELSKLIKNSNRTNIYMTTWSLPTIWGGASLLQMHLKALEELANLKSAGKWDWDFVINLSESCFPIKCVYSYNLKYKNKSNFILTFKIRTRVNAFFE